jgi:hypothetical protein
MVIKYNNTLHSKALQNIPKFVFGFENKPSGNPAGENYTKQNSISELAKPDLIQGCQIFLGAANQNGKNVPKLPQKYQMTIKYTKLFLPKGIIKYTKKTFLHGKYFNFSGTFNHAGNFKQHVASHSRPSNGSKV